MQPKNVEKIITYWQLTAKHDYDTMLSLFESKRYSDCLFYGHIVLEKILKGLVVKEIKTPAPYLHDLVRLQELAKIELSEKELDLLDAVNEFNIRSRYPEQKLSFYKQYARSYTQKYLKVIVSLYQKLCQMLK